MWGKYGRAGLATDGNIIRRMRIAYWTPDSTDTFSQYVILIVFPLQQWLREPASLLHLHIQCLFCSFVQQQSTSILQVNKEIFLQIWGFK